MSWAPWKWPRGKKPPQKADLGQDLGMYWNEELKRWVEPGKEEEYRKEADAAAAPPTNGPASMPASYSLERTNLRNRYVETPLFSTSNGTRNEARPPTIGSLVPKPDGGPVGANVFVPTRPQSSAEAEENCESTGGLTTRVTGTSGDLQQEHKKRETEDSNNGFLKRGRSLSSGDVPRGLLNGTLEETERASSETSRDGIATGCTNSAEDRLIQDSETPSPGSGQDLEGIGNTPMPTASPRIAEEKASERPPFPDAEKLLSNEEHGDALDLMEGHSLTGGGIFDVVNKDNPELTNNGAPQEGSIGAPQPSSTDQEVDGATQDFSRIFEGLTEEERQSWISWLDGQYTREYWSRWSAEEWSTFWQWYQQANSSNFEQNFHTDETLVIEGKDETALTSPKNSEDGLPGVKSNTAGQHEQQPLPRASRDTPVTGALQSSVPTEASHLDSCLPEADLVIGQGNGVAKVQEHVAITDAGQSNLFDRGPGQDAQVKELGARAVPSVSSTARSCGVGGSQTTDAGTGVDSLQVAGRSNGKFVQGVSTLNGFSGKTELREVDVGALLLELKGLLGYVESTDHIVLKRKETAQTQLTHVIDALRLGEHASNSSQGVKDAAAVVQSVESPAGVKATATRDVEMEKLVEALSCIQDDMDDMALALGLVSRKVVALREHCKGYGIDADAILKEVEDTFGVQKHDAPLEDCGPASSVDAIPVADSTSTVDNEILNSFGCTSDCALLGEAAKQLLEVPPNGYSSSHVDGVI